MTTPGNTTARGYGWTHQTLRARLLALLNELGELPCARCGKPIHPWMATDLGHTDDRTNYTGLEHARCNRGAGARTSNNRRNQRPTPTTNRVGQRSQPW